MNEEGLKLWEVIKLCMEGAYIDGDKFINNEKEHIVFYKGKINFECELDCYFSDYEFKYDGNIYEVKK